MTHRTPTQITLVLLSLLLLPGVGNAKDEEEKGGKKEKPVQYAVVLLNEDYVVVPVKDLKQHKKKAEDAYKEEVKAHKEAKKAAKKAKEKFDDPAPKKPVYKVVGSNLASEDEAKAMIEKILEEKRRREEEKKKKSS